MMREYLWGLTLTCISAVIVRQAAENDRSKKIVDMICSLCVICALVLPVLPLIPQIAEYDIGSFFEEGYDGYDGEAIYNGNVYGVSVEQAEEHLEEELCEKLGVKTEDIDVRLIWSSEGDGFLVEEATVYIHMGAMDKDPDVIRAHIEERTGVDCRIIY